MKTKPKMLIVENEKQPRENLRELFLDPPSDFVAAYGVGGFDVETASTGRDAVRLLKDAAQSMEPYYVMLLDLGLPAKTGGKERHQVGLGLLRKLDRHACLTVVIVSIHDEIPTFNALLEAGVAHFVSKPYEEEEVFRAVASAARDAQERLRHRWEAFKGEHQKWRGVLDCALVADRMALVVTEGTALVLDGVDGLARQLQRRYQLDAQLDRNDPVCQSVESLRQAALAVSTDCAQAREVYHPISGPMECIRLDELMGSVVDSFWDGLIAHSLTVEVHRAEGETVHTFPQGLGFVFRELLFHAVETSPDGSTLRMDLTRGPDGTTWEFRLSDNAAPLDETTRRLIEGGEPFGRDQSRYHGLCLAQRAAENIGAKLLVQPGKAGNTFNIRIPITAHDQIAHRR